MSASRFVLGRSLVVLTVTILLSLAVTAAPADTQWYLVTPRPIPNRDGSVSVDPGSRRSEWRTMGAFDSPDACEQARREVLAEAHARLRALRARRIPMNVAGGGRVLVNEDVLNYLPQTVAECVEAAAPR